MDTRRHEPRRDASPLAPGMIRAAMACLGLLVAGPVPAERPKPASRLLARADVPDDERGERRELARRSMRENCLICHSEELITSQKLTPPQWKTEVEKMVGWGAPVPPEQVSPLIDFLAEQYNDSAATAAPRRVSFDEAIAQVIPRPGAASGSADRGAALYAAQCATCHGNDGQGAELGPNLVEIALLLRPDDYHEVVRKGRNRMPGFQALLKPEQEQDILAWLRGRRYRYGVIK